MGKTAFTCIQSINMKHEFTENRNYLTKLFRVIKSILSSIYLSYATTHYATIYATYNLVVFSPILISIQSNYLVVSYQSSNWFL